MTQINKSRQMPGNEGIILTFHLIGEYSVFALEKRALLKVYSWRNEEQYNFSPKKPDYIFDHSFTETITSDQITKIESRLEILNNTDTSEYPETLLRQHNEEIAELIRDKANYQNNNHDFPFPSGYYNPVEIALTAITDLDGWK